jgi:trans-2,3-dihydro-3-hydroxyanthranilate isomerase
MAGHAVTWLDVFTAVPLAGNGLCVVHGADDIDDATMLAIARETRLSETTFVQTATTREADYRNRIFTLQGELPFAGHPSLGTAVAVAQTRGATTAGYVQETHAGLQPLEVTLDGARAHASMRQNPPTFGAEHDPAAVMAAAGLSADDAHPTWMPQVVSTGVPHLMAPVRDADALRRAAADPALLPKLVEDAGVVCLYLAAVDPPTGQARARSFFLGDVGVLEDPATGSAVGPLIAYLAQRAGLEQLVVRQGEEIGRPSVLHARLHPDGVIVAGDVVVVAEGRTFL